MGCHLGIQAALLFSACLEFKVAAVEFPLLGRLAPRSAREILSSSWSIGGETLDRDFAAYEHYKAYLGPLGAKALRLQAGWAKCEKRRGVYDWTWLDAIVDDAVAQGLRPWIGTSYGNPLYPGGGGTGLAGGLPTSPEALAAWDNWVRALVRRYRDRVGEWEVWNEPDIGKENTPEQYTALFIRTARIIRASQPAARIYALGLAGNLDFAGRFLRLVQAQEGLDLVDAITIHGYPRNPDDTSNIKRLRTVIVQFGCPIEVRQGETGAPSKYQEQFALSKLPWTENTQAKWNLRRMLAHHAMGVPFNLFTISDMHYRQNGQLQMNYKGLLGTHPDRTISHVKPAYFAAQRVFTIFDDSLASLPHFSCRARVTNALASHAFRHETSGGVLVTLWFNGAPPLQSNAGTPVDLTFSGVSFREPVFADLLTGDVRTMPRPADGSTFRQIPLYDSPVLITERRMLRIVQAAP